MKQAYSHNLAELRVLVTRPALENIELCKLINQANGQAIHFPVIAFADVNEVHLLEEAIKKLSTLDWLIFISPQAVSRIVPLLSKSFPKLPTQLRIAAVGASSAKKLKENGYDHVLYPEQEGSEALLALTAFKSCKGLKIAVIRGEGGRELIDKVLSERGAQILPIITHRRILPDIDASPIQKRLEAKEIDVIVCTSFEGIKNLKTLIGANHWDFLKKIPVCVASLRIKKLASSLGFETISIPTAISNQAILQHLFELHIMPAKAGIQFLPD